MTWDPRMESTPDSPKGPGPLGYVLIFLAFCAVVGIINTVGGMESSAPDYRDPSYDVYDPGPPEPELCVRCINARLDALERRR